MAGTLTDLGMFLATTFVAAVVTGLVCFAFGLIAAAVWLHIFTPLQTATLIVAFGLVVQGYSVWQLRKALDWNRLWPFIVGAAFGVPFGVALLAHADPDYVRRAVGVVLILYCLHALTRPAIKPITAGGPAADAGIGFCNGVLGGTTGLAGIVVTIWCALRGWPKDQQRMVFQPTDVAIFAMSGLWLGLGGTITTDTLWMFVIGLPVLLAGTWLGLRLYGRLDETAFRKLVLTLLLISGVTLTID